MKAVIRPVQPQDFDAWKILWDGYNAFYERAGPTALPEHITRSTWQRFFDAYEPVHCLVAEADGQLLGLTHYLYHRSTIQIGPNCYLQDLFTAEAARGKGVGRALIEAVYERAQADGCGRVYWPRERPTSRRSACTTRWPRAAASWSTARFSRPCSNDTA